MNSLARVLLAPAGRVVFANQDVTIGITIAPNMMTARPPSRSTHPSSRDGGLDPMGLRSGRASAKLSSAFGRPQGVTHAGDCGGKVRAQGSQRRL